MADSSKDSESDTSRGPGGSSGAGAAGGDNSDGSSNKTSGKQDTSSNVDNGGSKGSGSSSNNTNSNVDGVLSATLDDNSNDWRNSHAGGSQGGNSSDHFEPSTSFAEEDDDGVRPSDLYGKFTWKIENFSEISKRELRSNVFEVGEYKWYILVYPQGCDVSNHLSLFLCVADYDKLLPGWSHFAQFTIAVVNKDPKKSKYSDTLHRFCKKEHDWGWKKFMELSKVLDGFTVSDTLVIKAQVQVIREKQNRPFRCLDTQYRRELVRVYLTNVEGICRRFLEERREKLAKLRECPESFHEFWDSLSTNLRSCLASDRADNILKLLVKRFFNEKEVTSTLVMDALHAGYKSLQVDQRPKNADGSTFEPPVSISMEENLTYLTGDVMKTLESAANETVPPHNEDKDLDDYGKDSLERDERRLAELGRQAIEMFVLSHLYINRIEVAFKENEALKRQEALIREEEEAERLEEERQAKKAEAERERRNRRKEKKQRKKEKKEAEEAAAEAERKAQEEEKKRKEEEARKVREEAAEKERQAREAEREAARQAAKEKEAMKKAAKKAAQEEARRQMEAQQAASKTAASEEEKQQQQQQKQQKQQKQDSETSNSKSAAIQEKDQKISELTKKVEELELKVNQKDGTISKLKSQLKQTAEALQELKERSNEWQQVVSGSNPSTPKQQKRVANVDYKHTPSPPPARNDPGTTGGEPSLVPMAPTESGQPVHGMVSPIKAYAGGPAANQRVFQSMHAKGYQQAAAAAGGMPNNGPTAGPMGNMPQVPNGMSGYVNAGPQSQNIAGDKASGVVNGKAAPEYGHMMMQHASQMANQGSYRLAPVGQPVANHGGLPGPHSQDNSGLDDFAHMGLITDLLD